MKISIWYLTSFLVIYIVTGVRPDNYNGFMSETPSHGWLSGHRIITVVLNINGQKYNMDLTLPENQSSPRF
jgi:hypothetical protein